MTKSNNSIWESKLPGLARPADESQIGNTDHIELYKRNISRHSFSKILEQPMEYPAVVLEGKFSKIALKVFFDLIGSEQGESKLYFKIGNEMVRKGNIDLTPDIYFQIKSIVGDIAIYTVDSDESEPKLVTEEAILNTIKIK